jgi:hypothetical protein
MENTIMSATRRTVNVELPRRQLVVSLERPAIFRTIDDFRRACFSHAAWVVNTRGLSPDDLALLGQLDPLHEFTQQALTANRALCWQGEDAGVPASLRKPLGDPAWFTIIKDGGMAPVRTITSAFLSLFPNAS